MGIICAGATDIGRKIKTNQDSICLDHSHYFYAVADGMGGHNGGDIASQLSVKVMPEFIGANSGKIEPEKLMKTTILEVNKAILKKAGFADVGFTEVHEPVYYGPDVDTAYQIIFSFRNTKDFLARLDAGDAGLACDQLRRMLARHLTEGGVLFGSRAWIVTARVI